MRYLLTILFLLPLLAGAQTKPKPVSLKDSVAKYDLMVRAYKRMSGFVKDPIALERVMHRHDSAMAILNRWSTLYEDSVYHAKMKF